MCGGWTQTYRLWMSFFFGRYAFTVFLINYRTKTFKKKKRVMTVTTMDAADKPDIKNYCCREGDETHLLVLGRPNWLPPKRLLRSLEWRAPNPDGFVAESLRGRGGGQLQHQGTQGRSRTVLAFYARQWATSRAINKACHFKDFATLASLLPSPGLPSKFSDSFHLNTSTLFTMSSSHPNHFQLNFIEGESMPVFLPKELSLTNQEAAKPHWSDSRPSPRGQRHVLQSPHTGSTACVSFSPLSGEMP